MAACRFYRILFALSMGVVFFHSRAQLLGFVSNEPFTTQSIVIHENVTIPRRFEGFNKMNCFSRERYRIQQLNRTNKIIRFATAKFGYREKFKREVLQRRKEAINKFEWLDAENAIGLYKVPDHWRKEFPNHTQFLDNPQHESATGGGWWFWKSVVILEQLESLRDGDLLLYADNDLLTVWWPSISDLLKLMLENPEYDWAATKFVTGADWPGPELVYTKQDVFVAHCGSADLDEIQLRQAYYTPQWEAGIHIIRNSRKSKQFARQWKTLSLEYHTISDEPSYIRNHDRFGEYRRDQSLFNILLKCTYRVGLAHTQVPHNCGYIYDNNWVHFHFLKFPDRTDDELITLQERAKSAWSTLRTIKVIESG